MPNTPVKQTEVLDKFDKSDADKVEAKAVKLYESLERGSCQFAAFIRQLHDGNAHLLRGYSSFGKYIEATFPGMTPVNAYALSRQGNVLLILEKSGRISLEGKGENIPGTTGVRALSVIIKKYGEEAMLGIYDQAMATDRKITDETVQASTAQLIQVEPAGELEMGEPEEDEEDEDDEPQLPEKVQELVDHARDLAWGLPETADELEDVLKTLKAEEEKASTTEDEKWINSSR